MGHLNTCNKDEIIDAGGKVIENTNGTVSLFISTDIGIAPTPTPITKSCCEALDPNYIFNADRQECRWDGGDGGCTTVEPFKLVLNSDGNDGVLFETFEGDNCNLDISFDYLLNLDCASLIDILVDSPNDRGIVDILEEFDICMTLDYLNPITEKLETVYE
jgi:hypothetical protein